MHALNRLTNRRRAGFTMIETLIATTMLAIVLSAVGMTVMSGRDQFSQGMPAAVLEGRAARLLGRIVAEMQWAGAASIPIEPVAPVGASDIEFRVCTGFVGGGQQWSTRTRIQLVAEPTDPQDGADNDGDGLVDEGQVVLTRNFGDADEIQVVLGEGVRRLLEGEVANAMDDNGNGLSDEAGLSIVSADGALTIRLSVEARDGKGRTMVRSVQTAVMMRN